MAGGAHVRGSVIRSRERPVWYWSHDIGWVRKAEHTVDDAAKSKKYKEATEAAASEARKTGAEAKQTTKKATENAERKAENKAGKAEDGAESCEISQTRGVATGNSFAAGTRVVMADGSTKPIQNVQPGDTVAATNPDTQVTQPQQVTAAVQGTGDKTLVDLTLVGAGAGGGGPPATITATDGHKFYVPGRGWVTAIELKPGDQLRDEAGNPVTVRATHTRTQHTTVYNLTVDTTHTYYVVVGGEQVLVHNCNPGTKFDVPDKPGVYTIHLKDGKSMSEALRIACEAASTSR